MSSRFSETNQNSAIIILEHFGTQRETNHCKDSSSRGCYGNQFVQNQTKLTQNENGQSLCFQKEQSQKNTLNKIAREKQSVKYSKFNKNSIRKDNIQTSQQSADLTQAASSKKMEKNKTGKSKKITNRQNRDQREDELTEQVTETTFSRTPMVCLRLSGGQ